MRSITYAGETIITTDEVAEALVKLTAAIANDGRAEAVTIPIVSRTTDDGGTAELVIGVGNDVLSAPTEWQGDELDFSEAAETLRSHPSYPRRAATAPDLYAVNDPDASWDPDLDGFTRA
ncbi:hypothetical protein DEU34_0528 [Microbacterium sp. AG1240]|uniref:hypothetical protein n=1 Tax=Microbacterium sp. AG1240 TaxID=2183992 RepID=UPI000EB3AFE0|nr:hypothetical protein [Microbacterium sp. AG1240]RKT36022.1 hypothetical protein DEU34_0528 [Microbacterium sp. AG1240]